MEEMEVTDMEKRTNKCLFCNDSVVVQEDGNQQQSRSNVCKRLLHRSTGGKDLKSQLSTFFMLRKVLGLSPEFLEDLLRTCGSPSQWEIRLCRHCNRLFKEAEHLWDRMCQLQRDYEKVTFEIKDALISSMSSEEVEDLNSSVDKAAKKTLVEGRVKSCQVVEATRVQFFIDLQDELIDDDDATRAGRIPLLSSEGSKVNPGKFTWNEKGVPYLSLADFENKMKMLVETVITAQNELRTDKLVTSPPLQHMEGSSMEVANKRAKINQMDPHYNASHILKEQSDPIPETSTSVSDICRENMVKNHPASLQQGATETEEEEEEPLIRIVQTNTLMEPEDDGDEDNDAIPHVEAILKQDVDDDDDEILVINVGSDESPLTPNVNVDDSDPDYVPEEQLTPKSSNVPHKNGKNKKKINFLNIKVVRKAPSVFECSKCLGTFGARLGCQIHILRDHYGETHALFHCHICKEKFTLNHALRDHVHSFHGSTKTAYDDDFISESESTLSRAKDHKRRSSQEQFTSADPDHQTNTLIFECPLEECSDKFTNRRDLQKHTRSVHGSVLSKLVKKKTNFEPSPELECAICAKRNIEYKAVNIDILEVHYKKVHNGCVDIRSMMKAKIIKQMGPSARKSIAPKTLMMKCPECGKILPDSATMAEHLKNPENKCPECPKHFIFKVDMDYHLEMDHYNRNFNCPYCTKSFTSQIIYEKHIENHQNFDVHECEVCHLKITGFISLSRHIRHAHPEYSEQQQSSHNPEIFGL